MQEESKLRDKAILAAKACWDKKGEDLSVFNIGKVSSVADYFVICSASNGNHAGSIINEIERKIKEVYDEKPYSREGGKEDVWAILDYGDIVVHIMRPEARELYRLEKLWEDAPTVELDFLPEIERKND